MCSGLFARLQFAILKRSVPKLPPFRENYLMEQALALKAGLGKSPMKLAYLGGVQSLGAAQAALDAGFDAVTLARALIHDPQMIERWRTGESKVSGCNACNRCVAVMYGPAGTHCPVVGNALDRALKDIFAGETVSHAA